MGHVSSGAAFYERMRLVKVILVLALLSGLGTASLRGQQNTATPESLSVPAESEAVQSASEAAKSEGLPAKATEVFRIGSFPVTNSMVVTWIVAVGIIVLAQIATRRMKEVPEGLQNFWEWLVEGLYNFLGEIIGADLVRKTFWFFATIFIFILFTNWFGLVPGVGTLGWGEQTTHGFEVVHPLLRGGNADLNMTFAMAAIFMVLWLVWALQANGVGGVIMHLFGPKGESSGVLRILMIFIFFLVGFLEIFSIAFRPISLSFRLFGNVFAGENMLEAMANLVPALNWLLPVPFYFMELLVGVVQALVFMLLTAVFTMLICMHDEDSAKGHAAH